jgi:cell division protein FtsN
MWVAIAVCIIGAVLIFRDQGSEVPTGIGEYQTVVTAKDEADTKSDMQEVQAGQEDNGPRSGDVDINDQTTDLTPEKPVGETAKQVTPQPKVKQTTKPKTTQPAKQTPPPLRIQPAARGPYLVQTGSFGKAGNADREAARLQKLGYDARVKVGNTSNHSIIFRVRIGYFKSRTEADAFIRQNRKHMPNAIPAHL